MAKYSRLIRSLLTIKFFLVLCYQVSGNVAPLRSPCPRAYLIDTNYEYRGTLHFICIQLEANVWPRLDVVQYNSRQVIYSRPIQELGINQLVSFVSEEGTLRVLVSVPNRVNGTSVYSIDSNGIPINEKHTINTQLVHAMQILRLQLNNQWQLAIANQPTSEPYLSEMLNSTQLQLERQPIGKHPTGPIVTIHSWRATYFDKYQQLILPPYGRVSKLESMNVNGQEFLIVAIEHARADLPDQANSLIYKLDFGDGSLVWQHFQRLNTRTALDVSSFVVAHQGSYQRDYYIAVLGQANRPESNLGAPLSVGISKEQASGLLIYKYLGNRFELYRSNEILGATRLDTISYGSGDSFVLIAVFIAGSNSVSVFVFDGLNLRALNGPQPVSTQSNNYQRRSLESAAAMRLFLEPSASNHLIPNTTSKRTLALDESSAARPALALSTLMTTDEENPLVEKVDEKTRCDASSTDCDTEQLEFKIPSSEEHEDAHPSGPQEELQQQTSGQKRSFIPIRKSIGPEMLSWCKAQMEQIVLDDFETKRAQLLALPRMDQDSPIELRSNLLIDGDLHVHNLLYANKLAEMIGPDRLEQIYPDPLPIKADYWHAYDQIEQVVRVIDETKQQVEQLLVDDGTLQEVYTPLSFKRLVFECSNAFGILEDPHLKLAYARLPSYVACPRVGAVMTEWLNRNDVSDIQRQALISGRSLTIKRDIRFEHLVLDGQTAILNSLNDIPIEEIVFGRGEHQTGFIKGHKNLREPLYTATDLVVEQWLGQRVDGSTMLTSSGFQDVRADLKFGHVIIDGVPSNYSSRIESLNGLHLDTHIEQIALAHTDNIFQLPIRFEELVLNGPVRFSPNSHLSSIDLDDLWRNTMFKGSHQNITAPIEFIGQVQVSHGGDIITNGPINGLYLRPDNVMLRNKNYELNNPLVFYADLQVTSNLQLAKALNGIQIAFNNDTRQNELAILYDGSNQLLTGDKILSTIKLGGRTHISGQINGKLNLTDLNRLINNGQPFKLYSYKLEPDGFNQVVRFDRGATMHVDSTVNRVPIQRLCSLASQAERMTQNRYNRLKFDQQVSFQDLRCGSVNGFNSLRNFFLTRNGNQFVPGTLRLIGGVSFDTAVNISSTLNKFNVLPLTKAISQAIDESLTGHKEVFGDFVVDDLVIDGQINHLQMSDVFIAKSDYPQIIRAPMTFEHLDIENVLVIGKDLITNQFNGLNISEILINTLQYDAPQVIYNHLDVQNLHILSGTDLLTKSFNGHDLNRLFYDTVLVDKPQQIMAPKVFRANSQFNDAVYLRYGLDGISEEELRANLLLNGDDLIEDDLEFYNDVLIKKTLEIQMGSVNDIDVNQFANSLLFETPDKGSLRLLGNSSIRFKDVHLNNLALTGKIQNIDFSRQAIPRPPGSKPPPVASPLRIENIPIGKPRQDPVFNMTWYPIWVDHNGPGTKPISAAPMAHSLINLNRVTIKPPTSPMLFEHQLRIRQDIITDLSNRVNKHISASFYYDIAQRHPLLGPLLGQAANPIQQSSPLLLLKGMVKHGEPCLQRGQTVSVVAPPHYSIDSQISETSQPILSDSLTLDGRHYLFILDLHPPQLPSESMSQVLIYTWDIHSGRYDLSEQIPIDGYPTALRAFPVMVQNQSLACFALANPRVIWNGVSGPPSIRCQEALGGRFGKLHVLTMLNNVIDLDLVSSKHSSRILLAALTQHDTLQIGELLLYDHDLATQMPPILVGQQHLVRPIKLHFVKQHPATHPSSPRLLVVSQGITSNQQVQAITRIFNVHKTASMVLPDAYSLQEIQIIRDNQFNDIQSVILDQRRALVFMQSAHSISVLVSSGLDNRDAQSCFPEFKLIQRIPTRGANKFLAMNSGLLSNKDLFPYPHLLILSRDDCEHQQYSTLILRARFH